MISEGRGTQEEVQGQAEPSRKGQAELDQTEHVQAKQSHVVLINH